MMLPIMLNVLKKPVEKITLARQEEDCLNVVTWLQQKFSRTETLY